MATASRATLRLKPRPTAPVAAVAAPKVKQPPQVQPRRYYTRQVVRTLELLLAHVELEPATRKHAAALLVDLDGGAE